MASSNTAPAFARLAGHPLRWRLLTELAGGDLRVRELVALTGQPQNLVSYHLRLLRDGGLVTAARSSFDGRDSYYHLDVDSCAEGLTSTGDALHPVLRMIPAPPAIFRHGRVAVLFICTGNSARSPIAEALLRRRSAGRVTASSAGIHPKPRLHPQTVRILHDEYGIDVSRQRPQHVDALAGRRFDYVITLCDKAREVCREVGEPAHRIHWSIPDPARGGRARRPHSDGSGAADRPDPADFARAAADIDTRLRHLLPVLAVTSQREGQL